MSFWIFVAANLVFALGNSSDAFLALRTQNLGVAVRRPAADDPRLQRHQRADLVPGWCAVRPLRAQAPIALAWVIYGIAYIGFAVASSAGLAAALWILYGAYYGINDAVGKALIADVAPTHLRGTSYGILNFAVAIAVLPASLVAGLLWDGISPSAPFLFGGACALVAVVVLAFVRPAVHSPDPASN